MSRYDYFEYEGNISENKVSGDDVISNIRRQVLDIRRARFGDSSESTGKSGTKFDTRTITTTLVSIGEVIKEKSLEAEFSKGKKAKLVLCLMLVVVVIFTAFVGVSMHSINHNNKTLDNYKTDASKVCVDCVNKYGNINSERLYNDYKISGFRLKGLCFIRQLDFNDDGDCELMLCYYNNSKYYVEIWGYVDGKFQTIYSQKSAQSGKKGEYAWTGLYYENKKYWLAVNDENDITKVNLYRLKHDKLEQDMVCTYDAKEQKYTMRNARKDANFELIQLSKLEEKDAVKAVDKATKALEALTGSSTIIIDPYAPKTINDAYYSVIQQRNKEYGYAKYVEKDGTAYIDGLAIVDLVDFDGDGQNELVLVYRKKVVKRDEDEEGNLVSRASRDYCLEVYAFNKTKAVLVYRNEGISNNIDEKKDRYYVLKKKGKRLDYCINSSASSDYGKEKIESSTILKFNGKEFKPYSRASRETQYGYSQYSYNGEESYKSEFEEKTSGIPYFDGRTRYDNNKYTVEFVQRRKTIANGDMKNRVDKTVENIRLLNSNYTPND
ncbi:MAG: hypothetical protein IJT65_08230 [Eubacterium sp.]|nr:hypothetical protein [Eubacterium sp.]